MTIILDLNTLPAIFDATCTDHQNFKPVKDWIIDGPGLIIFGGTKYQQELKKCQKFFRLFIELGKINKTAEFETSLVDSYQCKVEKLVKSSDFDDPHIVALIAVSRCRLLASNDQRSYRFIKQKKLYPKDTHKPKIYTGLKNQKLLSNLNLIKINKSLLRE